MRPHVVIIGGGFGGLSAARALKGARVRITLVDRENHHLFQPLLYQVATAGLGANDIAFPLRTVLRYQRNVTVFLDKVQSVEPDQRRVVLSDRKLDYDYLIVATGATHCYFGNDAWAQHAPGLKTVKDALEIRRRVLLAFEHAERERDPRRQAAQLCFVVIGGGPTGVELAASLAETGRHTLARDFRIFDPRQSRVLLLEARDRILGSYPERLSARAEQQLRKLGVEVRTGCTVRSIDASGVMTGRGKIVSETVLWAAGVAGSPLGRCLDAPLDRIGRVKVTPTLQVPGRPELYVIGDLAHCVDGDRVLPGNAQVAIQQGNLAAANIRAQLAGRAPRAFTYRDRGSMAAIGRTGAIAWLGPLQFSGLGAWLAWLAIHLLFLIGVRNRIAVLFDWAWAYLTYQRSARVIISGDDPGEEPSRATNA